MKKVLSIALILAMLIPALIGCGNAETLDETAYRFLSTSAEKAEAAGIVTITLTDDDQTVLFEENNFTSDEVQGHVKVYGNDDNGDLAREIESFTVHVIDSHSLQVVFTDPSDYEPDYLVELDETASSTGEKLFGIVYSDEMEIQKGEALGSDTTDEMLREILEILNPAKEKSVLDYAKNALALVSKTGNYYVTAKKVLQMVGFIESPEAIILEGITKLSSQVDTMSKDMKSMYQNLDAKLSMISSDVRKSLFTTKASVWTQFNDTYVVGGIDNTIASFKSAYEQAFIGFVENPGSEMILYYDTEGGLTYPTNLVHDDGEEWPSIDGTLIDESKTLVIPINEKTFRKTNGFASKRIDDANYINSLMNELKAAIQAVPGVDQALVDDYADDAFTTMDIYALKAAMNAKGATGSTIGAEIIRGFESYCQNLTRGDNNPIDAYRYTITANLNFEEEAKPFFHDFDAYLYYITANYRCYADLAYEYGDVRQENYSKIKAASDSVVRWLEANTGLHNETEDSVFCYVTETFLHPEHADCVVETSVKYSFKKFVLFTTGHYDGYDANIRWGAEPVDWGKNISSPELQAILVTYQMLKSKYPENFEDTFYSYLRARVLKTKGQKSDFYQTVVVAGNPVIKDTPLDESVVLTCTNEAFSSTPASHPGNFFDFGDKYGIGGKGDGKASQKYWRWHKGCYSDCVDLNSGDFIADSFLVGGAVYGESHSKWLVDEAWLFVGIDKHEGKTSVWNYQQENHKADQSAITYFMWALIKD